MDFQIIAHMGRDAYPNPVKNPKKKPDLNAFFFVNLRSEFETPGRVIESLLTDNHLDWDTLQTNGDMDNNKKFALIQLFNGALDFFGL